MIKITTLFKVLLLVMTFSVHLLFSQVLADSLIVDEQHGGKGAAWGLKRCDACHVLSVMHKNTSETLRNIVREKSYASCTGCHGSNGTDAEQQCLICHNDHDLPYASGQHGNKTHNFINPDQENADQDLADKNCIACHNASNMNGVFELDIDLTLFADKNGNKTPYRHGNDFCIACHNRDHQQAGFEITGKDYRDPLIAMEDNYRFIDMHGIAKGSGKRTYSGLRSDYRYPAVVACSDCHAMHGTTNDQLIIANAYHGASGLSAQIKEQNISIDTGNGQLAQLCVICHAMDFAEDDADIDTGNGLSGVHQAKGLCLECHRHGMAVQTGL